MMSVELPHQLEQLFYMIFFAIGNFILLDFVTVIARQARWDRYQKMVVDFLGMFFCGSFFYLVLIWNNSGMLRDYIVIGLVIGVGIYSIFMRHYSQKLYSYVAIWMVKRGCRLKSLMLFPWRFLYRQIIQRIKKKIHLLQQGLQKRNKKLENKQEERIARKQ